MSDLPRVYDTDETHHHKGNNEYYARLRATCEAASRRPIDWIQVELAITYDRVACVDGWLDAAPDGTPRVDDMADDARKGY